MIKSNCYLHLAQTALLPSPPHPHRLSSSRIESCSCQFSASAAPVPPTQMPSPQRNPPILPARTNALSSAKPILTLAQLMTSSADRYSVWFILLLAPFHPGPGCEGEGSASQSVVPGPTASTTPGNLSEMQTPRPYP